MGKNCKDCGQLRVCNRAKLNGNNRGLKGARAECHCNHPKAIDSFLRQFPRSPKTAGFIGFTPPGESYPACKTAPRWCPLRVRKEQDDER